MSNWQYYLYSPIDLLLFGSIGIGVLVLLIRLSKSAGKSATSSLVAPKKPKKRRMEDYRDTNGP
jgi:hypothetical protein